MHDLPLTTGSYLPAMHDMHVGLPWKWVVPVLMEQMGLDQKTLEHNLDRYLISLCDHKDVCKALLSHVNWPSLRSETFLKKDVTVVTPVLAPSVFL